MRPLPPAAILRTVKRSGDRPLRDSARGRARLRPHLRAAAVACVAAGLAPAGAVPAHAQDGAASGRSEGARARFGEASTALGSRIADRLRAAIGEGEGDSQVQVGGVEALADRPVAEFYRRRAFRPAWTGSGLPSRLADDLATALAHASQEGLDPADYRLPEIRARLAAVREASRRAGMADPTSLAELEILLTDAFLVYGSHLLAGRVHPESIDPEWFATPREAEMAAVLDTALYTRRIDHTLTGLLPPQPGYWSLREALARYRGVASSGGWGELPDGPTLRPGDRDPAVAALRLRLEASGDLGYRPVADPERYDEAVAAAVRRFQTRHGLEPDGVLGRETREAMNLPVEARLHQIELNMERFRWLPQDLGERYVLVNIAGFELEAVERARTVMRQAVVVGRQYRRTPVFSGTMTYVVFNPYWEIPPNIAVQDKLPLIRRNPDYLRQQGIRVYRGWGPGSVAVDPAAVEWSALSARNFPFRLRQDPGPLNALGRVKLMFPNEHNVYLHDTPSRELFQRAQRDFSSGCIRVERPLELASWALGGEATGWGREAIDRVVAEGRERTVRLSRPVRVHLQYWTAWADEEGTIHFRRDLYGRDDRLDRAFHRRAPAE